MKNSIQILFFVLLLISCNEPGKGPSYENVEMISQETIITEEEQKTESVEEMVEIETYGSIEVVFDDFDLTFSNTSMYENRTINSNRNDTAHFYLELGEYLDSAAIEIHHGGVYDIEVFQMYENSITIMREGPHCDLIDWRHYYSDWVNIKKYNNYDFVAETYVTEDWQNFIDIDIEKLQNAVLEHCGVDWAEYVKDVKSISDYPYGVSMSRLYFKIELTNKQSQATKNRIIVIEIPMGC